MVKKKLNEKEVWNNIKLLMGNKKIKLGNHWSFNIYNDPKRLPFVLSRYKFAAKMCANKKNILELGCSEGIGVPILSEFALTYTGVDTDKDAINKAKENWESEKKSFIEDNFLGKVYGCFDAVISLDVIEHIKPAKERLFFETVYQNLTKDGIAIIGTPNIMAASYASSASRLGHVNLFDEKKLRRAMEMVFNNVFIFGVNDEVVHTGFFSLCHYFISIGCYKRSRKHE